MVEEDIDLKSLDEMIRYHKVVLNYLEHRYLSMIDNCIHYCWDEGACEESCDCDTARLMRGSTDFDSRIECKDCKYRKVRNY